MRKNIFCIVMVLVLGLTGCSERDADYVEPEDDSAVSQIQIEADLAGAYSGEKCMIYEGRAWNPSEEDKVLKAFFKDCKKKDYTREEQGNKTVLYYERKDQQGTSMSIYRENAPYFSCGIAFGTKEAGSDWLRHLDEKKEEKTEAYATYGGAPDSGWEKIDISKEEEIVKKLADQVEIPYYEPDYAVSLKKDTVVEIFWRQKIGGIPMCQIAINEHAVNVAGRKTYNESLDVSGISDQKFGYLTTIFWNGRLINWFNYDVLTDLKPYKEKAVVPVEQAYKKAAAQMVQDVDSSAKGIQLVKAALEYKVVGRDGKYYTYPVWNCIFHADLPKGYDDHYAYLVDACTGEFFNSIDAAFE